MAILIRTGFTIFFEHVYIYVATYNILTNTSIYTCHDNIFEIKIIESLCGFLYIYCNIKMFRKTKNVVIVFIYQKVSIRSLFSKALNVKMHKLNLFYLTGDADLLLVIPFLFLEFVVVSVLEITIVFKPLLLLESILCIKKCSCCVCLFLFRNVSMLVDEDYFFQ